MKNCIIFASHIPSPDKLYIGKEFLDKFYKLFYDYDIYVGVNNSCNEWVNLLDEYSKKLNLKYDITPENLLVDSDCSAFQTALRLLKKNNKKYKFCWFGHTKGATSGDDDFRKEVFDLFWDNREKIESKMLKETASLYSPYVTLNPPGYGENLLSPLLTHTRKVNQLTSLYTFWVHFGEVIEYFLNNHGQNFLTENITHMCGVDGQQYNRYFFESEFPLIYQKTPLPQKVLYTRFCSDVNYKDENKLSIATNNTIKKIKL